MQQSSMLFGTLPSRMPRLVGVVLLLLAASACEQPKKKTLPVSDTGSTEDVTTDTSTDATADTSGGGGDATEDTADDITDTNTAPSCDERLALLPSTDCGCGGQLICRDAAGDPTCIGALPENACGGCGGFAPEIGTACGFCGDGVWTCDPLNADEPVCAGATPENSCGGCALLPGVEGESCSGDGFFFCVSPDNLACVGPGQNACGGFSTLGEALGGPCGECGAGRFACDGTDALRCDEAAEPTNACGGCGTLPNRVGSTCGDCGGTWQCDPDNPDGVVCSLTRNVCGTCGAAGAGSLGESCAGGRLVCGSDGQLTCESNDRNLCGGVSALSAEPGSSCGTCGGVNICAGPERVACVGSSPLNACGGCGFLPGFPGTFCGVDHTWECNPDGSMVCSLTSSSVVVNDTTGGTTTVDKGSVTVPSGAVTEPLRITIRVRSGMTIPGYQLTSPVLEFGPAGTEFTQPLEVQIISDDAPASDMVWSNRAADGGGYSEVPGAVVEGDALVGDVSHFSLGFTGIPIPDTELCGDGADNDGDGLSDCDDSDCASAMNCTPPTDETECADGLDNDGDLLTDCEDNDCLGESGCGEVPTEICSDGADNDGDGMTDCADIDCVNDPVCIAPEPENCGDGVDNDGNGLTDCADPACAGPLCSPRSERCDNALDDDLDGLVDCDDRDCASDAACVDVVTAESDCGNGLDDDGDGPIDCADSDCSSDPVCSGGLVEVCDDGVDNDLNGWVDCDDGACSRFCGGTASCDNTSDLTILTDTATDALFRSCTVLETGVARVNCLVAGGLGTGCSICISDFVACGNAPACATDFNLCAGVSVSPPEVCNNRLDDNGNGLVDCADPLCSADATCGGSGARELCDNGLDDDSDGLVDCADADCAGTAGCTAATEICGNGLDDDGDGFTDCADLDDCVFGPNYYGCSVPVEDCSNGIDDNRAGGADCADSACATASVCLPPTENCVDGLDNDGDGQVDCADTASCSASVACGADASGSCLAPYLLDGSGYYHGTMAATANHTQGGCGGGGAADDIWSFTAPTSGTWCIESTASADQYLYVRTDCTGGPDLDCRYGYYGSYVEFTATANRTYFVTIDSYYGPFSYWLRVKPGSCAQEETTCNDGTDNDADGAVDCADVDCGRNEACAELVCNDDLDSDNDGLTDCADSDCASDPACFETACGDYRDNDGDTLFDCNDPDCAGSASCQEVCDDGIDNDGDGAVDCFDASCRGSAICPQQRCAGLGTYAYSAGNGVYYAGFGTAMTGCGPGEGCSLTSPPVPVTVTGATAPTYEGVCAPQLADGAACTADPADGYCYNSTYGGAGCIGGICRREGTYCEAGQSPGWRVDFLGNYTAYCRPTSAIAATSGACGDSVGKACGRSDDLCVDTVSFATNNNAGICIRSTYAPNYCPSGTRFQYESMLNGSRSGVCIPVVGDGATCNSIEVCDPAQNLVCGAGGTCRPVVVGEACSSASPLISNTSGAGPELYAVDRLDEGVAADESLNCSGTVGPEKAYFYTATAPVQLSIEVGSLDRNGPKISWYARTGNCNDIFSEVACQSVSVTPTRGAVTLAAGETLYLMVDSEARWSGGDNDAAEFFVAMGVTPVVGAGDACADAACDAGLNCSALGFCEAEACGDGTVDDGESCDDGNTVSGDGCSFCQVDTFTEAEPNDGLDTANAAGSARRILGTSPYQWDYFCVDVGPSGGKVRFRSQAVAGNCDLLASYIGNQWTSCNQWYEAWSSTPTYCFGVYSSYNGGGAYALDVDVKPVTLLAEHEPCGLERVTVAACGDIGGAPAVCRETSPRLHLGTCERSTCGDGYLDRAAGEACDDGNTTSSDGCSSTCSMEAFAEVEPNNGSLTARSLNAYRQISGTLSATSDYDYFKLTLTRRSHLEFEVSSTAFTAYSSSLGIQLLSSTSAVLFSANMDNYNGYSGARSGYRAGGNGYVSRAPALSFLEPGTYTIRVSASASATGAYTLTIGEIGASTVAAGGACDPMSFKNCEDGLECSVTTRTCATPVCGDGNQTSDEGCDDGNTTSGDGCSATCAVELYDLNEVSTNSSSVTPISGAGTHYTFADGSTASAIGFNYAGSYHYAYLNFDRPTRLRVYNSNGGFDRIWRYGAPSVLSSQGTQLFHMGGHGSLAYPNWLRPALPTPTAASWQCDGMTADGVCMDPSGGSDCMDCGARPGETLPSYPGYSVMLPPGGYIVELQFYDSGRPLWVVTGEAPDER